MTLHCLYRISDNGYRKVKFANASKKECLGNFLTVFPVEETTVFMDKCVPETEEFLKEWVTLTDLRVVPIDGGSSAQSFRLIVEEALRLPDEDVVYLVEDDYRHLPHSRQALLEAIERTDYVTLYDAPDKYVPGVMGGNPLIGEDGADDTRVILTPTRHWRLTNSTTCTFAVKVGTLREDYPVWKQYCFVDAQQTHPHDFQCFLALREKGRALLSPIPSLSTHCEPSWAAPLIDWSIV
jgi:hypothetical protein